MLTSSWRLKVIDFGCAVDTQHPEVKPSGNTTRAGKEYLHYAGTPQFMPPEAVDNKRSDFRNDLWSLGCTIFQVLTGIPPFQAPSEFLIFCKIKDCSLEMTPNVPQVAADLIKRLIKTDAEERLGANGDFAAIRGHEFFEGVDFDNIFDNLEYPIPSQFEMLSVMCLKAMSSSFEEHRLNIGLDPTDVPESDDAPDAAFRAGVLCSSLVARGRKLYGCEFNIAEELGRRIKLMEYIHVREARDGSRQDGYWERKCSHHLETPSSSESKTDDAA
eukprot:GHVU01231192.1.p1 GENE.GHVU01231192.1~~GHVU01231192.1.p1  ORF type:complete len:273 (+),score=28.59 GHVU01231192.1:1014-1832(+)